MKTALLVGSTGLVGKQLLDLLLKDDAYDKVIALSRKPLDLSHPKAENLVVDFDRLSDLGNQLKADDVFCCLGTTIKQAKTKEAFKKVDFEYPLEIAKLTKQLGAAQYLLVSALGANKNSSIFYNQVKGQIEESLQSVGFESLHILRPSLLLGERQDHRSGEGTAKILYKILGGLIPTKYKGIDSLKVAKAMLSFARDSKPGDFVHESIELQHF